MSDYMIERVFTMMLKNQDGTYQLMYPKTLAKQVMSVDITLEDHCKDFLQHIWETERRLLNNANKPLGYIVMDSDGHVPLNNISQSMLAINTEYKTIQGLLTDSKCPATKVVMVLDATDDPTVDAGWAIYRRTRDKEYWTLDKGWEKIAENESVDIDLKWEHVKDTPSSMPEAIDNMVKNSHVHSDLACTNKFNLDVDFASYDSKRIGEDSNVQSIWTGEREKQNPSLRPNDFWYKPSIGQSWWFDPSVELAPSTCYEKYRDQTTMVTSPKLRTSNTTVMRRMFYRCSGLTDLYQYDTRKCADFVGMFYECTSLKTVPPMYTFNGINLDNMFYGCKNLKFAPELDFRNAVTAAGMFSGCEAMEEILGMNNTKTVNDMREMFNGCRSLKRIPQLDCSGITTENGLTNTFNECLNLEEVSFVQGSVTCSISFENTKLDRPVILDIFKALGNVNNQIINLVGTPGISKLTDAERHIATYKGWIILPS